MANDVAHFSLLTWLSDPARGERKNIGVLLASDDGRIALFKALSLGAVNSRVRDQGILSQLVSGLAEQFAGEVKPTVEDLRSMRSRLTQSVQVTEPQPTAVLNGAEGTLAALFKAYVAPRAGGGAGRSKGDLTTQAENAFGKKGYTAMRNRYLGDFEFDLVVEAHKGTHVFEVVSFDSSKKEWRDVEHDVAHFLYSLPRTQATPAAIVAPPSNLSNAVAVRAHERTIRWLSNEDVPIFDPTALRDASALVAA